MITYILCSIIDIVPQSIEYILIAVEALYFLIRIFVSVKNAIKDNRISTVEQFLEKLPQVISSVKQSITKEEVDEIKESIKNIINKENKKDE